MEKTLLIAGPLAALTYLAVVILGGAIRPGYSHISNFVSELISAKAPNKKLLNPFFLVFNILTGIFGIGLILAAHGSKLAIWGGAIIVVEAVFGFATVFFSQDERDDKTTLTGTMHIILAGGSSLTTMAAMLLAGLWLKQIPGMTGWSLFTFISLGIVFVSGGLTAAMTPKNHPLVGLLERITIGGFLQWMAVIAIRLVVK